MPKRGKAKRETSDSAELPFVPLKFSPRPESPMSIQPPDTALLTAMPELPSSAVVIPPVDDWRDSYRWKPLIGTPSRTPVSEGYLVPDPSPAHSNQTDESETQTFAVNDTRRRKEHISRPPLMTVREVGNKAGDSEATAAAELPLPEAVTLPNDENIAPVLTMKQKIDKDGTMKKAATMSHFDRLYARKYLDDHQMPVDGDTQEKVMKQNPFLEQASRMAITISERPLLVGMAIHDREPNSQLGDIVQEGSERRPQSEAFEIHEDQDTGPEDKKSTLKSSGRNENSDGNSTGTQVNPNLDENARRITVTNEVETSTEPRQQTGNNEESSTGNSQDHENENGSTSLLTHAYLDVRMNPAKMSTLDRLVRPLDQVICVSSTRKDASTKRDDEFSLNFGDSFKVMEMYQDGWALCLKTTSVLPDPVDLDKIYNKTSRRSTRKPSSKAKPQLKPVHPHLLFLPLVSITKLENFASYCRDAGINENHSLQENKPKHQQSGNYSTKLTFCGGAVEIPNRHESIPDGHSSKGSRIHELVLRIRARWNTMKSHGHTTVEKDGEKVETKHHKRSNIMNMTWHGMIRGPWEWRGTEKTQATSTTTNMQEGRDMELLGFDPCGSGEDDVK